MRFSLKKLFADIQSQFSLQRSGLKAQKLAEGDHCRQISVHKTLPQFSRPYDRIHGRTWGNTQHIGLSPYSTFH